MVYLSVTWVVAERIRGLGGLAVGRSEPTVSSYDLVHLVIFNTVKTPRMLVDDPL